MAPGSQRMNIAILSSHGEKASLEVDLKRCCCWRPAPLNRDLTWPGHFPRIVLAFEHFEAGLLASSRMTVELPAAQCEVLPS
jgi:hypothetical protein